MLPADSSFLDEGGLHMKNGDRLALLERLECDGSARGSVEALADFLARFVNQGSAAAPLYSSMSGLPRAPPPFAPAAARCCAPSLARAAVLRDASLRLGACAPPGCMRSSKHCTAALWLHVHLACICAIASANHIHQRSCSRVATSASALDAIHSAHTSMRSHVLHESR
jgi:hypothetical protein